MKIKSQTPVATLPAILLFTVMLLQPQFLLAAENCRGIAGTGNPANGCGIGGTGNNIGGTGHADKDSGIGGTGIVVGKSGIGGTGHAQGEGGIGGTGIVGIITGFGSIWVDGLEVQYEANTPVSENLREVNSKDLAIGQVVSIEARGSGDKYTANNISLVVAVSGQISGMAANRLTVLGQDVFTSVATKTYDQLSHLDSAQLKQGDFVKVSGLRLATGQIVASRIERTSALAEASVAGPITEISGSQFEINGLKIDAPENSQLKVGQEIVVSGIVSAGKLVPRQISLSPISRLFSQTGQIQLQGYVGGNPSAKQIKVGGYEVTMSATATTPKVVELAAGELVQVSGHFGRDYNIVADKIEISVERPHDLHQERVNGHAQNMSEKNEHLEKAEHAERLDRGEYFDRPDHPDSPNRSESADRDDPRDTKEH